MSWQSVALGEITSMKYGKLPPKESGEADDYPIFTGYRLSGFSKEYLYEDSEVIVVARGVGGTGDVKMSPSKCWITNLSIVLSVNPLQIHKRFLFYRLGQEPLKEKLNTGAAQAQITIESLAPYRITIPAFDLQRGIADILTSYDDLIENNRRRMALLEESARLLYHEWFVRLRFPGYEHTPIVNGVPQGWERKTLGQLTSFLKRGISPNYDDEADGLVINQKCIRDGRVNLELARNQSKEVKPERVLQIGDVLVNSTGEGTLGRVGQVKVALVNCTVDTHVTIVRPDEKIGRHYFGQALMDWEPRFSTMGKGATNQTELSPAAIGETAVLVPSHTLQAQFEAFAEPLYVQVSNLAIQNQKLRTTRDLLLPRLMSGELAV